MLKPVFKRAVILGRCVSNLLGAMAGVGVAIAFLATSVVTGLSVDAASASQVASGAMSAGSVSDLTAQVEAAASEVHTFSVQYQDAEEKEQSDASALQTDQAHMQAVSTQLDATRGALRSEALDFYINSTGEPSEDFNSKDLVAQEVGQEYLNVVVGNVNITLSQLRAEESDLSSTIASVAQERQQEASTLAAMNTRRQAALSHAASLQALLQQAQKNAAAMAAAAAQAAKNAAPIPSASGVATVVGGELSPSPSGSVTGPGAGSGGDGGAWLKLRQCESGDNYQDNTGNGYYGAYQFSMSAWSGLGYSGRPDQASPATQDAAAQKLQAEGGWGEWPACSALIGLS